METLVKSAQQRLEKSLAVLSPQQIDQVADYAEYLRSKEEWEATQELLCNPDMKRAIDEGIDQIRKGETRPWREFRKDV